MSSKKYIGKDNMFKGFDLEPFKKIAPPKNDSKKTKEELKYIANIKLNKRFFQEKDDILGNFLKFLDSKKIEYDKKELKKILGDAVGVILELKEYFKRPRPFKIEPKFSDPKIESTKGYSYPQVTLPNLIYYHLSVPQDFPSIKKSLMR